MMKCDVCGWSGTIGECPACGGNLRESSIPSTELLAAIQKELAESFELAEGQLASEKLSGNRVKEEFWQGELAALHRMRRVVAANSIIDVKSNKNG